MNQKVKVLVNTSTYKENHEDKVTDVINNLIYSILKSDKNFEFLVLKPMSTEKHKEILFNGIKVKKYRYFWPNKLQIFHENGILPSLQKNKINILKLLILIISQFINLFFTSLKFKPDYIYAHWFLPQAIVSALVCKILKIKLVFTTHGAEVLLLNNIKLLNKILINFVLKNTYKFTANSEVTLNQIRNNCKLDYINDKYKVIPMGIQNKFFEKKNLEYKNDNHFLYIGRLVDYKGVDLLLRCLKKFRDEGNNFKLDILGTGVDENFLKKEVQKLGLENYIVFHGFKNFDEKLKFYKNASLTFVPSIISNKRLEGGPLTLIEAMSQRNICIVSDSIGFVKYCNYKNSLVFDSGNIESMYEKLIRYTEMKKDEKENMRNFAFEDSKFFKFENIGKIHSDFLFQ